jgi:hypothetical protein
LTQKVTFVSQHPDTTVLMNEQIEPSRQVIKRTLTITIIETRTITIHGSEAETFPGITQTVDKSVEQIRRISIGQEEAK